MKKLLVIICLLSIVSITVAQQVSVSPPPLPSVRTILSAATTFFVRTDGNDANTCLTNSAGGACLTIQGAYNKIAVGYDFAGQTVTISVADGTYTAGLSITVPWVGGGALNVTGNTGTPTNVFINTTNASVGGLTVSTITTGIVTIRGFKITATNTSAISQLGAGTISFNNIDFGAITGTNFHLFAGVSGAVIKGNSAIYSISGGAFSHIFVATGGFVQTQGATVTLTGSPVFNYFTFATRLGSVDTLSTVYSGSATGPRYYIDTNSIVYTGGAGPNYFPGDSAGTVSTGGQYL